VPYAAVELVEVELFNVKSFLNWTDVIILKIFSATNLAKILAFLLQLLCTKF
jgi:hypothetical protein